MRGAFWMLLADADEYIAPTLARPVSNARKHLEAFGTAFWTASNRCIERSRLQELLRSVRPRGVGEGSIVLRVLGHSAQHRSQIRRLQLLEQAVIVGLITEANVIHWYSWPVDPKMWGQVALSRHPVSFLLPRT